MNKEDNHILNSFFLINIVCYLVNNKKTKFVIILFSINIINAFNFLNYLLI